MSEQINEDSAEAFLIALWESLNDDDRTEFIQAGRRIAGRTFYGGPLDGHPVDVCEDECCEVCVNLPDGTMAGYEIDDFGRFNFRGIMPQDGTGWELKDIPQPAKEGNE